MKYRICVTKYGYADVEADNADGALELVKDMDDRDFDWSEFDEAEIVEEFDE
jgi:hypothetical protein